MFRDNPKPTNSNPQKEPVQYKAAEKVSKGKGGKYVQFEDSEDHGGEEPHQVFKQYEDASIDLEYNFNNLLINIENFNPELLPPAQQPNPLEVNNQNQRDQQQQQQQQQQAFGNGQQVQSPLPEIPEEELLRIHHSYLDIYSYMTLFYLVLFGISTEILPPIAIGIVLWIFDILILKKRISQYFRTAASEKAKRRKYVAYVIECFILTLSKVKLVLDHNLINIVS